MDVLLFDATNAATYPNVWRPICQIMKEMRSCGEATPQITFILHTRTKETVEKLWNELYKTGEFDELLFRWEGKPLLVADAVRWTKIFATASPFAEPAGNARGWRT